MSLLKLWGSWFGFYIIGSLLAVAFVLALVFIAVLIPGNKDRRGAWLLSHHALPMIILSAVAMGLASWLVYWLANWWFATIAFTPHKVAVFGAVGINVIAWISKLILRRDKLRHLGENK